MRKYILVLLTVAVIAVSCGPVEPAKNDPVYSAVVKHQDDIPVPVNFTYLEEKSQVETFSDFRLCEMVYENKSDARHGLNAIKDFYLSMMPKYNWTRTDIETPRNALIFKKNNSEEFCRIEVYRDKSKSMVYILIGNEKLVKAEK